MKYKIDIPKKLKLEHELYEYALELTSIDWERFKRNPWEIRSKIHKIVRRHLKRIIKRKKVINVWFWIAVIQFVIIYINHFTK